jgi:hypothetical protein
VTAVPDHQPVTGLIDLASVGIDVGGDLGPQRDRQHPPCSVANDLVDQRRAVSSLGWTLLTALGLSSNYGEHGSYLPDRRWRAGLA